MKLVSVIIPAYNQGKFIAEAIESVLAQDYPQEQMEIIVVDDGSTDGTREIIERLAVSGERLAVSGERLAVSGDGRKPITANRKPNLRYIYQPNQGKAMAVKAGIEAAQGKYIFLLDADDIFLPNKIKTVVDVFEKDNEIIHVSHPVIYWYTNRNIKVNEVIPSVIIGRKILGRDILKYFFKNAKFYGGGSSFAGRAEFIKKIPIKSKDIIGYIDHYLALFTLNRGHSFYLTEPLSIYRIHGENNSLKVFSKEMVGKRLTAKRIILSEILSNDFDEKIKLLFTLDTKVFSLKAQEISGAKPLVSVIDSWMFLLKNYKVFGLDIFKIIKNYRILQRSMPNWIINLVRAKRR